MTPYELLMEARQTGRTTKLLRKAIALASKGKAVYVICVDRPHMECTEMMLRRMVGSEYKRLGIKFECEATTSNINWNTFSLYGAHHNCVALFDHYTLEDRIMGTLKKLHDMEMEPDVELPFVINHTGNLYG